MPRGLLVGLPCWLRHADGVPANPSRPFPCTFVRAKYSCPPGFSSVKTISFRHCPFGQGTNIGNKVQIHNSCKLQILYTARSSFSQPLLSTPNLHLFQPAGRGTWLVCLVSSSAVILAWRALPPPPFLSLPNVLLAFDILYGILETFRRPFLT